MLVHQQSLKFTSSFDFHALVHGQMCVSWCNVLRSWPRVESGPVPAQSLSMQQGLEVVVGGCGGGSGAGGRAVIIGWTCGGRHRWRPSEVEGVGGGEVDRTWLLDLSYPRFYCTWLSWKSEQLGLFVLWVNCVWTPSREDKRNAGLSFSSQDRTQMALSFCKNKLLGIYTPVPCQFIVNIPFIQIGVFWTCLAYLFVYDF